MLYQVIGLVSEKVYVTGKTREECNRILQEAYPSVEPWEKYAFSWAGIDSMAFKNKEKIYDEPLAIVPVNVNPDYVNGLTYLVRHRVSIELSKGGWKRRKFNREE